MESGLDLAASDGFRIFQGQRIGLLCHQASLDRSGRHVLDSMLASGVKVVAVFGPQHGLWGHTQDDMIEWEGSVDARTGLTVHSLYGETRKPRRDQLAGLDRFVIDLFDVGARYYTFVWTATLCLEACAEAGVPVTILDRPNPLGGLAREGTVLQAGLESFVGRLGIPMRHGMTLGEIVRLFADKNELDVDLEIVGPAYWDRNDFYDASGAFWAPPSPNMPTLDTAIVYPGACLLEGTNLSEGRGTTRPFETAGAPFLNAHRLADALHALDLPGVYFRPVEFQPTFQKHVGEICGGVFVHVLDRWQFRPVATYTALLRTAIEQSEGRFEWKPPPYEYEYEKLPFDILAGNVWLRESLERLAPLEEVFGRMEDEISTFEATLPNELRRIG